MQKGPATVSDRSFLSNYEWKNTKIHKQRNNIASFQVAPYVRIQWCWILMSTLYSRAEYQLYSPFPTMIKNEWFVCQYGKARKFCVSAIGTGDSMKHQVTEEGCRPKTWITQNKYCFSILWILLFLWNKLLCPRCTEIYFIGISHFRITNINS